MKAVVLFALLLVTPHGLQAQQTDDDVIHINTSLVTLPVKATDRKGRVAHGLKQEQFRVFENGVEQEIVYFEPPASSNPGDSTSKPLTIALMLDVSDSTQFKLQKIQGAALAFVSLLRPGDLVLVVSFDRQLNVLTDATADRTLLSNAIQQIKTGGGTSLYSALDEVINKHLSRFAGRKAIVLLTDGVDTTSKRLSFDGSLQAAEAADVTIFPVQYPTYTDFSDNPSRESYGAGSYGSVAHVSKTGEFASEAYKRATLYLRLLADKTAGHFQFADSAKSLTRSFETIANTLREQYTLGYYPKSKAEGTRNIEVKVLEPNVSVRTRKSYRFRRV